MTEIELLEMLGKESITIVVIIIVYALFIRPKDQQITDLVDANKKIVEENSQTLGDISHTLERVSTELTSLSGTQKELKEGQDELWKEVIRLKGGH